MLQIDDIRAVSLFSALDSEELERLAENAADMHLAPGDYAVHEGGERALFAVLSGKIEVVKLVDGIERRLGWRETGAIFGEIPIVFGTVFQGAFRAAEPSRVMRVDAPLYFTVAARAPAISEAMGAIARERIGGLQSLASQAPQARLTMLGHRWDRTCADLRRFLARNQINFNWVTRDSPDLKRLWPGVDAADDQGVLVKLDDGTLLRGPSAHDLAEALGLQTRAQRTDYDTMIIGGGPGGLAAAVYGASEGLSTIVVEREAPGGQAGTSTRIENYLGFPSGVSGDELSSRALQQARRLGAEILVTRRVTGLDPETGEVCLDGDEVIRARTIVLATGVTWRRLEIEGFDQLIGKGIYYGAARSEAGVTHGLDVHLIGAGNSAGQAALHFANHARSVSLVVRGDSLAKSMSHYLIEQLQRKTNVSVQLRSEVQAVHGDTHLTAIDVRDASGGITRQECGGLFVFIGADADTAWLPEQIARDRRGFVLTGDDVVKAGRWSRERDPYLLETSVPGVFACGDVRLSPVKRVAAAVGEGSMAIALVHQYLAQDARAQASRA